MSISKELFNSRAQRGFTLVELIAVLVIAGILAGVAATRMVSSKSFQLQAGRDFLISALFVAQQKAMTQTRPVQLRLAGSQIDIRLDANNDGAFSANESLQLAGQSYPVTLPGNVSATSHNIVYDSLGHTPATGITLSNNSRTVVVNVSATGFAW